MNIALAINVGSSSIKAALFDDAAEIDRFTINGNHELTEVRTWLDNASHVQRPDVIGHRIVHGGQKFTSSVVVNDSVLSQLNELIPLAPLHLPLAINAIEASRQLFPGVPQVACFDTAFHASLPRVAYDLALPPSLTSEGIRRYGFHGLNCEHVVESDSSLLQGRSIIAHLGNGSSLTAVLNGKSVDTTMAFTPNSGIPMGTRSGDLDPGVIMFLLKQGHNVDNVDDIIQHHSGLAAWSNGISDMKTLLETNTEEARFATEAFCTHVAQAVAKLSISLGGLDTLVFTGGIGEHCAPVRDRVVQLLAHFHPFKTQVVAANEEAVIARHALVHQSTKM